ncbi:MAG: O-antigen ligase family protein [Bacteroidales bacterium]|nr:O-antigen ligase family protein [Bacteroidales bacterium]
MVKNYKWYDCFQYGVLWLTVAAMVVNWQAGLWMTILFALATVTKILAQGKIGNPTLSRPLRWALLGPVVYWAVLALSLLWTSDTATGLEVLQLKAVLLVCPLGILLSDTSYLTSNHLRGLGYALLAALCGAFLYFAVRAGVAMLQGTSLGAFQNAFYSSHENGRIYHHAYIALYAVVAMGFVYHELTTRWSGMKAWLRWLLIVSLPLLICYVVLVNSRAGMLAMGMAAVACVLHLTITRRSWKLGLGIGVLVVVGIVAATQLVPGYKDRISSTFENVEDDARTSINRCNWHAYCESPVWGYGVGDYHARQVEQYGEDGFEYGANASFNAHNQYMESLLAAGVPGLLALLFFLLMPLVAALRRRSGFLIALLVAVVAFNLLFESMFERQMGLLFVGWMTAVMALIMSVEENKFARSPKS